MNITHFFPNGRFYFLLISFLLIGFQAHSTEVSYVVWQNGKPIERRGSVDDFLERPFKGRFFEIIDVPTTVKPDKSGCYCYPTSSPSFAYSHVYFYANDYFEQINLLLKKSGHPNLSGIKIRITTNPGNQPGGASGDDGITLSLADSLIDPTILAHEIGHELHRHLSGNFLPILSDLYIKKDWSHLTVWLLLVEGTANFVSSLVNFDPRIGRYDWDEVSIDINSFIRFPDLIVTQRDKWQSMVNSYSFARRYPKTVELAQKQLLNPDFPEIMDLPDPYLSSAAINQPLWKAVQIFGRESVVKVYFEALHDWMEIKDYSDFAKRIVSVTHDKAMAEQLARDFKARGLLTD